MQIGAVLLCKSAKVRYESIEYGVLSIGRGIVSGGRGQPQVAGGGRGRGATVSRPGVRVFEVAICDLKRDSGGRVADASLPRG